MSLKATLKYKFRAQRKGRFLICVSVDSKFTSRAFFLLFFLCVNFRFFSSCFSTRTATSSSTHPRTPPLLICSSVVRGNEWVSSGLQGPIHTDKPISQEPLCAAKLDYTEVESLWRKQSRQESESLRNTPFQKVTAHIHCLGECWLWIQDLPSTIQEMKFFIALE